MDNYNLLISLHTFAVIALIGPLILTPKWLYLYHHNVGKKVLKDIHFVTGYSGLIVFISGGILLWLQDTQMLSYIWMETSIGLFIGLQVFDHFWADKEEEKLENNSSFSIVQLKIWLIVKLIIYFIITFLMLIKAINIMSPNSRIITEPVTFSFIR